MTRKIALVGCGSAKNPGVLPAKDKYSSNYFTLKRRYGEEVCDEWYILSAKFGLLDPDNKIDDYDVSIDDLNDAGKKEWATSIEEDLWEILADEEDEISEPTEVHFLLGSTYLDPVAHQLYWLANNEMTTRVFPFEDTSGIGKQMSVLKKEIEQCK